MLLKPRISYVAMVLLNKKKLGALVGIGIEVLDLNCFYDSSHSRIFEAKSNHMRKMGF